MTEKNYPKDGNLVNINKASPESSGKLAVREFMQHYGLTLEIVSMHANCTRKEAYDALHLQNFEMCPLILVAKVWGAVEQELSARGWNGKREHLWKEFNAELKKHRLRFCKAPTC